MSRAGPRPLQPLGGSPAPTCWMAAHRLCPFLSGVSGTSLRGKQSGRRKGKALNICFPLQDHLQNAAENLQGKQSVRIPGPANVNMRKARRARGSRARCSHRFPGAGRWRGTEGEMGSSPSFHPVFLISSVFLCDLPKSVWVRV